MRHDFLGALACVEWVEANLISFDTKLENWLKASIDIQIEDQPPPATHNPIVAIERQFLPPILNVEFGAYINGLRSGLDILATALAERCNYPDLDLVYFPIAKSKEKFASGEYKGAAFVKALPDRERAIIESLEPYSGGNEKLWALHRLDILRKHKRLIDVEMRPLRITLEAGTIPLEDFTPAAGGWMRAGDRVVLGLMRKGAPPLNARFFPCLAVNEPGPFERKPVMATLFALTDLVRSIISQFDI